MCDTLLFQVRDRDARLPASEFGVKVPWADEVMVTISDLEDKRSAVRDLRDQVAELQSTNDYTLRMKVSQLGVPPSMQAKGW